MIILTAIQKKTLPPSLPPPNTHTHSPCPLPALYTHLAAVSEVLPRHLVGRVDGGLGQHDEEGLSVLSVPGNVGLQGTRGYGDCWLTLTVW